MLISGFRLSPVARMKVALCVVGMRLSPFTSVLRLLCFGYRSSVQNGRTDNEAAYVTVPFVCRADAPRLWLSYQAIQLSSSYADFHPHAQRVLGDFIYRRTPVDFTQQQHATLPIRFPHPDKLWDDRLFCFTVLSGYLYLPLAKGGLSYAPLRAHHLLLDARISCTQRLDLGVGQRGLVCVLA